MDIYVTTIEYIDQGASGFLGCESPPKIINIRVYEDPSIPVLDVTSSAASQLNTSSYLFEYCDTYGADNVTLTSSLPDAEAYYNLYNEDMVLMTDWNVNSFEFTDIGYAGSPGTDTTIYISRVLNDSTYFDPNGEFSGCESSLIELTVNVYQTSSQPDDALFATGRTDYYICSGEPLAAITSPSKIISAFLDNFIKYPFPNSICLRVLN